MSAIRNLVMILIFSCGESFSTTTVIQPTTILKVESISSTTYICQFKEAVSCLWKQAGKSYGQTECKFAREHLCECSKSFGLHQSVNITCEGVLKKHHIQLNSNISTLGTTTLPTTIAPKPELLTSENYKSVTSTPQTVTVVMSENILSTGIIIVILVSVLVLVGVNIAVVLFVLKHNKRQQQQNPSDRQTNGISEVREQVFAPSNNAMIEVLNYNLDPITSHNRFRNVDSNGYLIPLTIGNHEHISKTNQKMSRQSVDVENHVYETIGN